MTFTLFLSHFFFVLFVYISLSRSTSYIEWTKDQRGITRLEQFFWLPYNSSLIKSDQWETWHLQFIRYAVVQPIKNIWIIRLFNIKNRKQKSTSKQDNLLIVMLSPSKHPLHDKEAGWLFFLPATPCAFSQVQVTDHMCTRFTRLYAFA